MSKTFNEFFDKWATCLTNRPKPGSPNQNTTLQKRKREILAEHKKAAICLLLNAAPMK